MLKHKLKAQNTPIHMKSSKLLHFIYIEMVRTCLCVCLCGCASGRELHTRTPAKKRPSHCRVLHSFLYPKHLNINTLSVPDSLCLCVCIAVRPVRPFSCVYAQYVSSLTQPKKKLRPAIVFSFSFSSIQPASSRCVEVLM